MELNKKYIVYVVIAIAGYLAGHFTQESIIEKEFVEVEKEVLVHRDIIRTIERPDGTKETIIDKSIKDTKVHTVKVKESRPAANNWIVGVGVDVSRDFKIQPNYILSVDRRILGDVYAGVYYSTDHAWGVSVKYNF